MQNARHESLLSRRACSWRVAALANRFTCRTAEGTLRMTATCVIALLVAAGALDAVSNDGANYT